LDEINSLDISLQAKILRVIQEKVVTRVGGTRNINIDVRIIAAANQDLKSLAGSGEFRADLFHRLNVIEIELPALKERGKQDLNSLRLCVFCRNTAGREISESCKMSSREYLYWKRQR